MKIPILVGRDFVPGDDYRSTVIISRRVAMEMYGKLDVLGKSLTLKGYLYVEIVNDDAALDRAKSSIIKGHGFSNSPPTGSILHAIAALRSRLVAIWLHDGKV